jgi:predicted nucleic acid-binding protein
MDNVLIDTDVIMDFFFDRKPFSDFSSEVIGLCADDKISGFTTPVIISNVYYLLRKTAEHRYVVDKISRLLQAIEVIDMGKSVVIKALNSSFNDFEDALQNFSAVETGSIDVIITRNIKDFQRSELAILTPEAYLKTSLRG